METIIDVGVFDENAGVPIIVGSTVGMPEVGPLLACCARPADALRSARDRCQQAGLPEDLVRLGQLARFYGLSVRLVCAAAARDRFDLLSVGAEVVSCDTIVTMAGSLVPTGKGWYDALTAVGEAHVGSVISPMLAYDDHSVKWAGAGSPRTAISCCSIAIAGYPLMAIAALQLTRVDVRVARMLHHAACSPERRDARLRRLSRLKTEGLRDRAADQPGRHRCLVAAVDPIARLRRADVGRAERQACRARRTHRCRRSSSHGGEVPPEPTIV